jgi:hypothetical protein
MMIHSLLRFARVLPDWFFVAAAVVAVIALAAGMMLACRRSSRGSGLRLVGTVALALTAGAVFYRFAGDLVTLPPIDAADPIAAFAQSVGYALDSVRAACLIGAAVLACGILYTVARSRRWVA